MIRRLLFLNGLAALGAVLNHASGWGFTAMLWWTERHRAGAAPDFSRIGSASYYILRAIEQLIMFSIPAFLFVSGFFIAFAVGREQKNIGWNTVGARIKNLVFPYILWSVAIFVGRGFESPVGTPGEYFKSLICGGASPPYYYIPLLIQFFLLSPLIVLLVRRHWKPALLASGLIQFVILLASYPVILGRGVPAAKWIVDSVPGCFFPHSIFWFVFGVFAGFHLPILKGWLGRCKRYLPAVTIILALLAFAEWELLFRFSGADWLAPRVTVLDAFYAGSFILSYLAFERTDLPFMRQFGELGAKSFGVYLVHAPLLELISRATYHFASWVLAYPCVFVALLVAASVGIPLLFMNLVNHSPARPYYRFVFG